MLSRLRGHVSLKHPRASVWPHALTWQDHMTRAQKSTTAAGAGTSDKTANASSSAGPSAAPKVSEGGVKKAAKGIAAKAPPLDPLEIEKRIQQARKQLQDTEKQIYNLETAYFDNTNVNVNALRGYEALLSTASASGKKGAQFRPEERIFSASSVSSGVPFVIT